MEDVDVSTNLLKVVINFEDVYGLDDFLIGESTNKFLINTPDPKLEVLRIRSVLYQLQTNAEYSQNSGKFSNIYLGPENQTFVDWSQLTDIFNRTDDICLSNLIVLDVLDCTIDPDYKLVLKKLFQHLTKNSKKVIFVCSLYDIRMECVHLMRLFGDHFLTEETVTNITFHDLTEETQHQLLNRSFIYFKEKNESINEFFDIGHATIGRLNKIFNSEVLQNIINHPEQIPKIVMSNSIDPSNYVDRCYYSDIFISLEVRDLLTCQTPAPDRFIFTGVKEKIQLANILKVKDHPNVLLKNENILTFENFEEAISAFEEVSPRKVVHLLEFRERDEPLIWIISKGSLGRLQDFAIRKNTFSISEVRLFEKKTVVLCGSSGAGKTTTLARINKYLTASWIIHIDLSNFEWVNEHFNISIDRDSVITFLTFWTGKHPLLRSLLGDVLFSDSSKRLALVFDAFDEVVDCKFYNYILQLLQFLRKNSNASIFVAVQPQNCSPLENALFTFSTSYKDILQSEQCMFLYNVWARDLGYNSAEHEILLMNYVHEFYTSVTHLFNFIPNVVGVPFLLHILAEIGLPPKAYFANPSSFKSKRFDNLLEIVQTFIGNKYQRYRQIIFPQCRLTSEEFAGYLNKKHISFAVKTDFTDGQELLTLLESEDDLIDLDITQVKLILSKKDGSIKFAHRIFAEYFLAYFINEFLFVSNEITLKKILVSKFFSEPKYIITRLFLNDYLNTCYLTINNQTIENILYLWDGGKILYLNRNGESALHILMKENLFYIVLLFLNPNFLPSYISLYVAQNKQCKTALILAYEQKHFELIDTILSCFNLVSAEYQQELVWASLLGHPLSSDSKLVLKIDSYGWIPDLRNKNEEYHTLIIKLFKVVKENKLDELLRLVNNNIENDIVRKYLLRSQYNFKVSMLHLAASNGLLNITNYLVNAEVPVDILDHDNATPLHHASLNGHLDIVKFLHSKFARLTVQDDHLQTPLSKSVINGHFDIVNFFLEDKCLDINVLDKNGMNVLEYAAKFGCNDILKLLIEKGSCVNHCDNYGMSALSWAADRGYLEIADLLISIGANTKIRDHYGRNLVHIAVEAGQWNILKYLTFCRVEINVLDWKGVTPFQLAVQLGMWTMVKHMILEGAYLQSSRLSGFDPIPYVLRAKKWCLVILMVERGASLANIADEEKERILDHIVSTIDDVPLLFDQVIRLGNVELLQILIKRLGLADETKSDDLDSYLAEAYEKLLLRNADISQELRYFVEGELVLLRTVKGQCFEISEENELERLCFIQEQIKYIEEHYWSAKIDKEFLFRSRFIAQNIELLKRQIKGTKIPWEQIEFCLLVFMNFFIKPQYDDFCYRLVLDHERVIRHLSNFSEMLSRHMNKQNPCPGDLESLESDFRITKDVYSLKRISYYIQLALTSDSDNDVRVYVLMRCLQVIGESFKNTKGSPNLSKEVHQYMLNCASKNVMRILTALRDSLSHHHTFKAKAEIEKRLATDIEYFRTVQNDLQKIKAEIDFILYMKMKEACEIFYKKCRDSSGNWDTFRKICRYIDWDKYEDVNMQNYEIDELKLVKSMIVKLTEIINDTSLEEEKLFSDISDAINKAEINIASRINQVKSTYFEMRSTFRSIHGFSKALHSSESQGLSRQVQPTKYTEVAVLVEKILKINDSNLTRKNHNEIIYICKKLLDIMLFGINRISMIKGIENRFSNTATRENHTTLNNVFNKIENNLSLKNDRNRIRQYILRKQDLHEQLCRIKLVPINVAHLVDQLCIENKIKRKLKECLKKKKKNLQHFKELVNNADDLEKLLKNINDNKFHEVLKDFFLGIQHENINNAVNQFIKDEETELQRIYSTKLGILFTFIGKIKVRHNSWPLQSAIEILSLDIMEVCASRNILTNYTMSFEEFSPLLVGKALRNYLAHGNLLVDTLPFNPLNAVVSTIKHLSTNGISNTSNSQSFSKISSFFNFEKCLRIVKTYLAQTKNTSFIHLEQYFDNKNMLLDYALLRDDVDLFSCLLSYRYHNLYEYFLKATNAGALRILAQIRHYLLDSKIRVIKNCVLIWPAVVIATNKGHKHIIEALFSFMDNNETDYMKGREKEKCYQLDIVLMILQRYVTGDNDLENSKNKGQHKSVLNTESISIQNAYKMPNSNPILACQAIALHIVALSGRQDILELLLSHDINVRAASKFGTTALHLSAIKGDDKIVEVLLTNGADIDAVDENLSTPLHFASMCGQANVVKVLLDHKANVNAIDRYNQSALHGAAQIDNYKVVEYLLKYGAKVNATDNNNTALHIAASNGYLGVATAILSSGDVDVNVRNENNLTALHLSSEIGCKEIVDLLLKSRADVNIPDKDKKTALHLAAENGYANIAKVLIDNGGDIYATTAAQFTPLHFSAANGQSNVVEVLLSHKVDIEVVTSELFTPLHLSALNGHIRIVQILLANDANIRAVTMDSYTALHLASISGHEAVVKTLLDKENNTDAVAQNGMTALHLAVQNNNLEVVRCLLNYGAKVNADTDNKDFTPLHFSTREDIAELLIATEANINAVSTDGLTPLHLMAQNGHEKVAKVLVEKGADVNACTSLGNFSALHISAQYGHEEVINVLLENSCDIIVDIRTQNQDTPLHTAVINGQIGIVIDLLRYHADVNAESENRFTPLHYSAKYGHLTIAEILLRSHANINATASHQLTSLHWSVTNGHKEIVELLLDNGADINARTVEEATALHLACERGLDEIVKLLLKCNANVNAMGKQAFTALQVAAQNGHVKIVKDLIAHHANINSASAENFTSLHFAAQNGHYEVVKLLLENQADVNFLTIKQFSPLHLSVAHGHYLIVEVLLKYYANKDIATDVGITPLHLAVCNGHEKIVNVLLEYEANVNVGDLLQTTPLHLGSANGRENIVRTLIARGANVNAVTTRQVTPLYLATQNGHQSLVQYLIKKGAVVNSMSIDKITPLHHAIQRGFENIVVCLLQNGANVDLASADRFTALHLAVQNDCVKIVSAILNRGPNIEATLANKFTPLHLAASYGNETIVKKLIDHHANVNVVAENQFTPLHLAAQRGYENVVQVLLDCDADVNAGLADGATPLHLCVSNGHAGVVKILIENKANINALTEDQATPLHTAVQNGFENVARILLDHNAEVDAASTVGLTPLHLCAYIGHAGLAEMLIEKSANINAVADKKETPLHVATQAGYEDVVQILLRHDAKVDAGLLDGTTSLHLCAYFGNAGVAKILIKNNANINAITADQETPLQVAAEKGHREVVQLLLDHNADITLLSKDHLTAAEIANRNDHEDIVLMLAIALSKLDV